MAQVEPAADKELFVSAKMCSIVASHAVNKVSDIDKETWDILDE